MCKNRLKAQYDFFRAMSLSTQYNIIAILCIVWRMEESGEGPSNRRKMSRDLC